MEPKYPDVHVQLTGEDGNAYAIMGRVSDAIARHLRTNTDMTAKEVQDEKNAYLKESMSSDYDNLLQTATRWVDVS